jgi:hypothetical protein
MASLDAKLSLELTEELSREIKALRTALEEKSDAFKAIIAEEVKKQVKAEFAAIEQRIRSEVIYGK